MELSKFNEIKEKIAKFVEITDANISSRVLSWAKTYSQILSYFVEETKILANLKTDLDEIYGNCLKEIKEKENRHLSSKEQESYILANPVYKKHKVQVNQQEMIVNYLENLLTMVKNLQYNLKSYIDLKMFLGGK